MPRSDYDASFYERIGHGSRRSAEVVCGLVHALAAPGSVLDVGCGTGAWLAAWRALGVQTVLGLDGAHVDPRMLLVSPAEFRAMDLAGPFDLGRRFDLVQSLEVAEHLPPERARGFVEALSRHGDVVLFSAAPPGQIGLHHLNMQPYEYWRRIFDARGFDCFDVIRPPLIERRDVEPWYRFNTFLYVRRGHPLATRGELRAGLVPVERRLRDVAPLGWRLRRLALRAVPGWLGTAAAAASARRGGRRRR